MMKTYLSPKKLYEILNEVFCKYCMKYHDEKIDTLWCSLCMLLQHSLEILDFCWHVRMHWWISDKRKKECRQQNLNWKTYADGGTAKLRKVLSLKESKHMSHLIDNHRQTIALRNTHTHLLLCVVEYCSSLRKAGCGSYFIVVLWLFEVRF